jgi:hypothetical protein
MSANETQVAGDHYRRTGNELQHWDLAVLYQWDPFQYQITKYLMRWKYKHATPEERLKDLQKAAHFLQKYIEVYREYDTPPQPTQAPAPPQSNEDWQVEGYYGDLTQHYKCRHCGAEVRAASTAEATAAHGNCAQPHGYVNQGD